MSTAVMLRSQSRCLRTDAGPGPAPRFPHTLIALWKRQTIEAVSVSTHTETIKTLQPLASNITTARQSGPIPIPIPCTSLPSDSSEQRTEDAVRDSDTSATSVYVLPEPNLHETASDESARAAQVTAPTKITLTPTNDTTKLSVNWEELTTDEKEQCRGPRCPTLRLGKSAWFVVGPLHDAYLNHLGELIKRLHDKNFRRIRQHSQSGLNFSPVLLSASEDINEAEPVILILTGDARLGHRARATIMQSEQYSKHNLGFKMEVDIGPLFHTSDDVISSVNPPNTSERVGSGSICSRTAFVTQLLAGSTNGNQEPTWTRTTIGGVLLIRGCYYALIVAHCLLKNTGNLLGQSENDDEWSVDAESEFVDVGSLDQESQDQRLSTSSEFGPIVGDFAVYMCSNDASISRSDETTSMSTNLRPQRSMLLGRIKVNSKSSNATFASLVSFEHDWALVPVTNPFFQRPNCFFTSNQSSIFVNRIGKKSQKLPRTVYIGTGALQVQKATVVEQISYYAFPWTRRVQEVFTIDVAVSNGDSGAWIFDSRGYLYGMAVATAPDLSLTYALHIEDIFADVSSLWPGEADVDHLLPQGSVLDVDSVPKDTLYASKDMVTEHQEKTLVSKEQDRQAAIDSESIPDRLTNSELSNVKLFMVGATLMLITFTLSFDAFVLYNVLPSVTDYFDTVADIGWYASAYWICVSTLPFPFKYLSEGLGGLYVGSCSIVILELGCFGSGFAKNSSIFIGGRALAGAGSCGAMISMLEIVRRQTLTSQKQILMVLIGIAFLAGLASGSVLGGIIAQYATWRWCFWLNPSAGFTAIGGLLVLWKCNIPGMRRRKLHRPFPWYEISGVVVFASVCVLFLLWLLSARNHDLSWNSPMMVGLVIGSILAGCFVLLWLVIWLARELRGGIRITVSFGCGCLAMAFSFGSAWVVVCYLSLWCQSINRQSALESTSSTWVMILGVVMGGFVNMLLIHPRVIPFRRLIDFAPVGAVVQLVGTILMRTLDQPTKGHLFFAYQWLIGLGSGMVSGRSVRIVRIVRYVTRDGEGSGASTVIITWCGFGAAVFVAVSQCVFIHSLSKIVLESASRVNGSSIVSHGATNFWQLASTESQRVILLSGYNNAIREVFFVAIGCSAGACFTTLVVSVLTPYALYDARMRSSHVTVRRWSSSWYN